jgi:hypothetical protein
MTTAFEFSELQAVDFAFGRLLATAFDGLADKGPVAYRRFLERASNEKIVRHDYDAPHDFISAYMGARKAEQPVDANTKRNRVDLPIVAYCRKPGMKNAEDRGGIHHDHVRWADGGQTPVKMSVLPITLEYKLMMLAWDKLTLDKLQLAWYAFVSNHPGNHHVFDVPYQICDSPFVVKAFIQDSKAFETMDISLTKDEMRIFGVEATITVVTQVIMGEDVTVGEEVTVAFRLIGHCGLEVPCCE